MKIIYILIIALVFSSCGGSAGNSKNKKELSESIDYEIRHLLDDYKIYESINNKANSSQLLSVDMSSNIIKLYFNRELIEGDIILDDITDPIYSTAYFLSSENNLINPIVKIYFNNESLENIIKDREIINEDLNKSPRINNEFLKKIPKKIIVVNGGHGYTEKKVNQWGWQRPLIMPENYREDIANAEIAMILSSKLKCTGETVYSVRELDKLVGPGISGMNNWKQNARQHFKSKKSPTNVWNKGKFKNADKDIRSRPFFANSVNANVMISLHTNAANKSAYGTQVYISKVSNGYKKQSEKLAKIIIKHLRAEINSNYDKAWKVSGPFEKNHGENRLAKMPSIIIELGFHTNKNDLKALLDNKFREISMEAVTSGIKEYLKIGSSGKIKINVDVINFSIESDEIYAAVVDVSNNGCSYKKQYDIIYKNTNPASYEFDNLDSSVYQVQLFTNSYIFNTEQADITKINPIIFNFKPDMHYKPGGVKFFSHEFSGNIWTIKNCSNNGYPFDIKFQTNNSLKELSKTDVGFTYDKWLINNNGELEVIYSYNGIPINTITHKPISILGNCYIVNSTQTQSAWNKEYKMCKGQLNEIEKRDMKCK